MGNTSTAVALNRVSRVLGYSIQKGFYNPTSPNLPQRIAILGEANHANQSNFTADTPVQITSAGQAAVLFGWGSPIHIQARILFPVNGGGVSCPVYVYPQAEGSNVAQISTLTVGGASTSATSGTLYVLVSGRSDIDGVSYAVPITAGQSQNSVASAIGAAINAVLSSPVTNTVATNVVTSTTKWKGLSSDDTNITVIDNTGSGFTFTFAITTHGSGVPSVATSLANFGNDWNTIVINGYGLDSTTITTLEGVNGTPDPTNPTGKYTGVIMRPFIALSGSLLDDPTSITDVTARKSQVTIAVCPAPKSLGYSFEAAANYAYKFANQLTNAPHLDIAGQSLPDMPLPASGVTFAMQSYNTRDTFVKKGCSTVDLVGGVYQIQDFVTTYHPDGENPPIFAKCRDIMGVDMNIYYSWKLIELLYIVDHVIANDNDIVTASNVCKPKDAKALIYSLADDVVKRALVADATFMKNSADVEINSTNPQRLDCTWSYKRTGNAAIVATTVTAGFNF